MVYRSDHTHEKKQDLMHSSFVVVFVFSGLKYVEYRDDGMIQNNTI